MTGREDLIHLWVWRKSSVCSGQERDKERDGVSEWCLIIIDWDVAADEMHHAVHSARFVRRKMYASIIVSPHVPTHNALMLISHATVWVPYRTWVHMQNLMKNTTLTSYTKKKKTKWLTEKCT